MKKIIIINGPNLNMLGIREPSIYGSDTLESINTGILSKAKELGVVCEFFQSNHEGAIIDCIQNARNGFDGIIINPGAYTHYSYAIRDAVTACGLPCIEVHMSNVYNRDEFRTKSVVAPVCIGQIAGFGRHGYILGLYAMIEAVKNEQA
ncbi:MAG: type II 3-dehydroquinate dehydratase [Oscillospiraceae bacterium]|jgi:3-dehydroquinate dehydratase-2